jgi:hypothetical protein
VGASLCATLFLLEARNVMFLVAMLLRRDQERTLLMPKGDALVGLAGLWEACCGQSPGLARDQHRFWSLHKRAF